MDWWVWFIPVIILLAVGGYYGLHRRIWPAVKYLLTGRSQGDVHIHVERHRPKGGINVLLDKHEALSTTRGIVRTLKIEHPSGSVDVVQLTVRWS